VTPVTPSGGGDDYRKTPFLSILLYVLVLMGAMALLAAIAVWLLRR